METNKYGVGLDAGTMFLVGARQVESNVQYTSQRNCFVTIEEDGGVEDMLTSAGAKIVKIGNRLNVLGEDAIVFSNLLSSFGANGASLKRPMKDGVLNSQEEKNSISVISSLIEGVIGKPKYEKEICVFSAPSNPINSDKNNIFHGAMLSQILTKLGYEPVVLNEGLSVIYAENPTTEQDGTVMPMSGIAMSLGAGQVNVCMAVRGYPVVEFSVVGSGDYIDQQVSVISGRPVSTVTKIKETKLDFDNIDYGDMVLAGLEIHYSDLLRNLLKNFAKKFSELDKSYDFPVEIVISGGTSKPNGFENKFNKILEGMTLPFKVKRVRMASDLMNSVAKGCLIRAMQVERKNNIIKDKTIAEKSTASV